MTLDIDILKARVLRQRTEYPGKIAKLATDCWIRVMCDFSAEGVWDREGCATLPEALPISLELMARIYAWQEDYERLDELDVPVDSSLFEPFINKGFLIAIEMKRQLPDWTIIYLDERRAVEQIRNSRIAYGNPVECFRQYFEYEITDEIVQSGQMPFAC